MSVSQFDPDDDAPLTPEVLDRREAEAATLQIVEGLDQVWDGLARLVKIQGWRALGYASFRTYAVGELGYTIGRADAALRKTNVLLELSETLGKSVAELAPTVSVRAATRKPPRLSPLEQSLKASVNKFSSVPLLTSPSEIAAARKLRDELNRLLPNG